MGLKYWETMAEREKTGAATAGPAFAGALRMFDRAAIGQNTDEISQKAVIIENNKTNIIQENEEQNLSGADENETGTQERLTNLPRPLALIFGTLLILISTVGISILTAVVFVIAIALAAVAAALLGGGIFAIYEAFANIAAAPVVSLECMGIGFAAIALGIIVFVLASKCGFDLLPKTTGLYPKAIKTAINL